MDRRKFIGSSIAVTGAALLSAQKIRGDAVEKFKIEYIRDQIPAFDIPPYSGIRYEDRVPDTLDIAERARLGVHCLTANTDPRADHEIYWTVHFDQNPPVMVHDFGDWCQNVEGMLESLPLLRMASGSDEGSHVDRVWMQALLKSIGPDGLIYVPLNGTPWARLGSGLGGPLWRPDGTTTDIGNKSVSQVTHPTLWPRAMAAMAIYHIRDGNPMWKQAIEQVIQGMSTLISNQDDYGFFPPGGYEPNMKFLSEATGTPLQMMPTGVLALDGNSRVIQGLAQYYQLTGYEPARVLATQMTNFVRFHADAFDVQGRFRFSAYEKRIAEAAIGYCRAHGGNPTVQEIRDQTLGGHFHSHTIGLLSILEFAGVINDKELLEWCKSSYEWAKTQSSSLVGFFPELISPEYPSCETCEVADMIGIAVKLTLAGAGDYWDDLDRWVRNHFAESQLTDGAWISSFSETFPTKTVAFYETADGVATRNLGGFAGWSSGNEWCLAHGIMHCCTGNATRAIYYVWEDILQVRGDQLQLNLLLNRASAGADVYSFIPYEGRVRIKIKRPFGKVLIRVPEWIESGTTSVAGKINAEPRPLQWEGRYVNIGSAKVGDIVDLSFPIATRTVTETLGTVRYTFEVRGNTVVSVDPRGKYGAIYERAYYKASEVPWRTVQRFVPDREISW
jgi:PAS domain-containing protein